MSTFKLEISTPEAEFLSVDAEAVTMSSRKGSMTVLPGHAPMLVALTPGEINVKVEGKWRAFLSMDGFVEVTGDQVSCIPARRCGKTKPRLTEAQKKSRRRSSAFAFRRVYSSITIRRSSLPARCRASVRQGKTAICECSAPKILTIFPQG